MSWDDFMIRYPLPFLNKTKSAFVRGTNTDEIFAVSKCHYIL